MGKGSRILQGAREALTIVRRQYPQENGDVHDLTNNLVETDKQRIDNAGYASSGKCPCLSVGENRFISSNDHFIHREDKEAFRLWYECLVRSCLFWDIYHVQTKQRVAIVNNRHNDLLSHINEVVPSIGSEVEKNRIREYHLLLPDYIECFVRAVDDGFDLAWEDIKRYGYSYDVNVDIMSRENLDTIIDYASRCVLKKSAIDSVEKLKEFIYSLPMFNPCRSVTVSICPFGKTKKEIQKEVWSKVSVLANDKIKEREYIYAQSRWIKPCGEVKDDEIRRYLGVFDLTHFGFTNSQIANCEFVGRVNDDNPCINEVERYYGTKTQSKHNSISKDLDRVVTRDRQNAKIIIANAMNGYFPVYQTSAPPPDND